MVEVTHGARGPRWLATLSLLVFALGSRITVAQGGTLSGSVKASTSNKPIANAEIALSNLDRSVRSDSLGRFMVKDLPIGTHTVTVRHIGFEPYAAKLIFKGSEQAEADFVLNTLATLERVDVKAAVTARNAGRLTEFNSRRRAGFGKFITAEEFEKFGELSLPAILSRKMGDVSPWHVSGVKVAATSRGGHTCPVQVIVNGVTMYNGEPVFFDINFVLASTLIGLEYYNALNTPVEFQRKPRGKTGGSGCGTLILWTK